MNKTPLALGLGVVAGVLLAVTGMAIVDDGDTAEVSTGVTEKLTKADCEEVIAREALKALGWKITPATVEIDDFRCGRVTDAGSITVNDTAIVADAAGRPEEAKRVFDDACTSLGEDAVRDPAWLNADGATCVVTSVRAGRGQAELHLLTGSDEVVRIHVVMHEPTAQGKLRKGLDELVSAAEAHY